MFFRRIHASFGSCQFWFILFLIHASFGSYQFGFILFLIHASFGSYQFWFILFLIHASFGSDQSSPEGIPRHSTHAGAIHIQNDFA